MHLPDTNSLFVFYQGAAYTYDISSGRLRHIQDFEFRNPLFLGTTTIKGHEVAFGEYFPNTAYRAVHIFKSKDNISAFEPVFTFPPGSIWHVHGVHFDPFTGNFWICTGDKDGECKIVVVDSNFREVAAYGDGTQKWRAVSLFFLKDRVVWGMDSPLAPSHVMSLDRQTGKLDQGQRLPGPVWYGKQLQDGHALLQTSVENLDQPGVTSNCAQIFATADFDHWSPLAKWKKDAYPNRYFRNGVLMFADGPQSLGCFALQGEALEGFDGHCAIAKANLTRLKAEF